MSYLSTKCLADISNKSPKGNINAVIISTFISIGLLIVIGPSGSSGKIILPAMTILIGIFLYQKQPLLYFTFTWWIWFLAPIISRIIEYKSNSPESAFRLIIATPYILSFLSIETAYRKIPAFFKKDATSFLLAFMGIAYALTIGLLNNNPKPEVAQELLSWVSPVLMGFFILSNWRRYPEFKNATQNTFLLSTLIMGSYGIYQYLVVPPWDLYWWEHAENVKNASGIAEPGLIRVWSTLNFPFTFGYVMTACISIILTRPKLIYIPIYLVGIISLLLSQVRAGWLVLGLAFTLLIISSHPKASKKILVTLILTSTLVIPFSFHPDFKSAIQERVLSVSSGGEDVSLQERQRIYSEVLDTALKEFIGKGIGSPKIIDAGVADVLTTLGWIGTMPVLIGILIAVQRLFQGLYTDRFRSMTQSLAVSMLVTLPLNNIFILLPGLIFWSCIGFACAADRYHKLHRLGPSSE